MDTDIVGDEPVTDNAPTKSRRRQFSPEFKRQIVEEALEGRESVSVIARRHDINANQLFKWKRQYQGNRATASHPSVLPIQLKTSPGQDGVGGQFSYGGIEIVLRTGHRITVQGEVPGTTLRMVLEVLS
ncbi:MAG: transposase [Gammaproteobacteria bacterium]|nr:transposase [Gammaproteobacteria bacterium]